MFVEVYDAYLASSTAYTTIDIEFKMNDIDTVTNILHKKLTSPNFIPLGMPILVNILMDIFNENDLAVFSNLEQKFDDCLDAFHIYLTSTERCDDQFVGTVNSVMKSLVQIPELLSIEKLEGFLTMGKQMFEKTLESLTYAQIADILYVSREIANFATVGNLSDSLGFSSKLLSGVYNNIAQAMNIDEEALVNSEGTALKIMKQDMAKFTNGLYTTEYANIQFSDNFNSAGSYIFSMNSYSSQDSSTSSQVSASFLDPDSSSEVLTSMNHTLTLPISNWNNSDPFVCVFLDANNSWSQEGCRLVKANIDSIECECNHFSVFSGMTSSAYSTAVGANFAETVNIDALSDINLNNATGLYVSLALLLVYAFLFMLSYKKDLYEDDRILFMEESSSKWQRTKFHILTRHPLLNIIYQRDVSQPRTIRATLYVLVIFGDIFLMGLFYSEDPSIEVEVEMSFQDILKGYSWNDFWVLVYSLMIMWIIMKIPMYFFKLKTVKLTDTDEIAQKVNHNNKIKINIGIGICWLIMAWCVWSIVLYSIQFDINMNMLWGINIAVGLLVENCITAMLTIALHVFLVTYLFKKKKPKKEETRLTKSA